MIAFWSNGEEKGLWRTCRCLGRESPRQGTCSGRPLKVCRWCTDESAHTWAAMEPSLRMVTSFHIICHMDTNKSRELKGQIIPAQRSLALYGLNRCRVIRSVITEKELWKKRPHQVGVTRQHLGVRPTWISIDIIRYESMVWKDIAWISFGKLDIFLDLSNKRYPLKISKRYPDISIQYPSHVLEDKLSNAYVNRIEQNKNDHGFSAPHLSDSHEVGLGHVQSWFERL